MNATTNATKASKTVAVPKRLWLIAMVASVVLWACGGGNGGAMAGMDHGGEPAPTDQEAGTGAGAEPTCTPTGVELTVSAEASKFDAACLAVPAGPLCVNLR